MHYYFSFLWTQAWLYFYGDLLFTRFHGFLSLQTVVMVDKEIQYWLDIKPNIVHSTDIRMYCSNSCNKKNNNSIYRNCYCQSYCTDIKWYAIKTPIGNLIFIINILFPLEYATKIKQYRYPLSVIHSYKYCVFISHFVFLFFAHQCNIRVPWLFLI